MKRPSWWRRSWPWPGGREGGERPGGAGLPPAASGGGTDDPSTTFLRAMVAAFGAERGVLYRLDRDRECWVPERAAGEEEGRADPPPELAARGHPLSWCLREELVAQLPRGELAGDRRAGGWALAGPVPGSDRVLLLLFGGSPPGAARRAVEAARRHLASLEAAGVLEGGSSGEGGRTL